MARKINWLARRDNICKAFAQTADLAYAYQVAAHEADELSADERVTDKEVDAAEKRAARVLEKLEDALIKAVNHLPDTIDVRMY